MKKQYWIARDKDGDIFLHFSKPAEDYVTPGFWISNDYVNVSRTSLDGDFSFIEPGSATLEIDFRFQN